MRRLRRPSVPVASGERVLATAPVAGSQEVLAGTREALYLPGRRLAWEHMRAATWDQESGVLTVTEAGEGRAVHRLRLDSPARLLQLVRERVTASLLLERVVPLPLGTARVVARRGAGGERTLTWSVEFDDLADPEDPRVVALVTAALASARDDVGEP
ncbi:hypothetical protein JCM18899A_36270 [Nocardioides sp. AN3]